MFRREAGVCMRCGTREHLLKGETGPLLGLSRAFGSCDDFRGRIVYVVKLFCITRPRILMS